MDVLLTIGDFSRATHLSVKTLRHYHDVGVLAPATIDPATGYRSYAGSQVPTAQVIRRLRDLQMPLDQIRTVIAAPDLATRDREIAVHLQRMEAQLDETRASVASLRALLAGPVTWPAVTLRTVRSVTALAVSEVVDAAGLLEWGTGVFHDLAAALAETGLPAAGCAGALFPGDFFEQERSELTVFLPVAAGGSGEGQRHLPPLASRVGWQEIPAAEVATLVHEGAGDDVDRTYGALATAVAERAIGVDGPIREYYLVGFADTDDESRHRTEICWPVFGTGQGGARR